MKVSVITPSIRPAGLKHIRDSLLCQTYPHFEWLVEINTTGKVDFNKAMNNALRRAKGDLIVFLQDFITINPDGIRNFVDANTDNSRTFFTAPVGKKKASGIKWDWRKTRKGKVEWQEWEIDWACAPRKALIEIGGFDEELDNHWGFDNVNVACRANLASYKFECLPNNTAVAIDHDAIMEHPFRKLRNENFHNERLRDIRMGNYKSFI